MKGPWERLGRNKVAMTSIAIIVFFGLIAVVAPLIAPYNPSEPRVGERFEAPSAKHPMGTDDLGKDIYSGVVYGTRVSLVVGFFASAASTVVGIIIGAISGYFGGRQDDVLMRITEMFQVIPAFFLATLVVSIFGATLLNVVIVVTLVTWPATARLARAEFLSLREKEFATAAVAAGASNLRIIGKEILPNALPPIIVNATLVTGTAILLEAGLSFLGLGDVTAPSWGLILHYALPFMRYGWWLTFFPGAAISVLVICLNLAGDGLNDALNPKVKDR